MRLGHILEGKVRQRDRAKDWVTVQPECLKDSAPRSHCSLGVFFRGWLTLYDMLCSLTFPTWDVCIKQHWPLSIVIEGCNCQLWDAPDISPGHPLPTINLLQKASSNLSGKNGIGARLKLHDADGWWYQVASCKGYLCALSSILPYPCFEGMNFAGFLLWFFSFHVILYLPLTFSFFRENKSSI